MLSSRRRPFTAGRQALPTHVPIRLAGANDAQAEMRKPQEIDEEVAGISRLRLDSHGGQFGPPDISHKTAGLKANDKPLHARLRRLLEPGQLRSFVDKHPDVVWTPQNPGRKPPGTNGTLATAPATKKVKPNHNKTAARAN